VHRGMILTSLIVVHAGVVSAQIVNPRITTDASVDTFSAETIGAQITTPEMTDEQKAVACWKFMLDHFYHWTPVREPDSTKDTWDVAKLINSYGYGPCFVNAPVLSGLWTACGFETRCWTITGHSIPEVKYGGAWHMLDGDARGYHKKADGQIAGVRELSKDAKLLTDPPGGKSDPFYPYGAPDVKVQPFTFWGPPSKMMDLYLSRKNNYQYNRRAVLAHPMYLTLRQGESLTLNRRNEGKFYMPPKTDPEHKHWKGGPREVNGKYAYGNGRLLWQPNLKTIPQNQLLWMGSENAVLKDGRIVQEKAGVETKVIFRIRSPYVLLQARAMVGHTGKSTPLCAVSFDGGVAWSELPDMAWENDKPTVKQATIDVTRYIHGRYEYQVRLTFNEGAVTWLKLDNLVQVSQLALPRLKPGKNIVKVLQGPQEGVVQLVRAKGKQRKPRYVIESDGLAPKSVAPAKRDGTPAYAVYRLRAPAPLTALSIGASMTMDPGKPFQEIAASYSIDGGKTWTPVWKQPNHKNWGNSHFEMDKRVALQNAAGVKEALIRFDMRRSGKYFSISAVRLYGFYRQPQPKDAKLGVELGWQEKIGGKWSDRSKKLVVENLPHEFDLECGGEEVRVARISLRNAE